LTHHKSRELITVASPHQNESKPENRRGTAMTFQGLVSTSKQRASVLERCLQQSPDWKFFKENGICSFGLRD